VGWEILRENLKTEQPLSLINNGIKGAREFVIAERKLGPKAVGRLREKTRWNLQKVLKFRDESAVFSLTQKAGDYIDSLLAQPLALKTINSELSAETIDRNERSRASTTGGAGHRLPGETIPALTLAKRALRRPKRQEKQAWSTARHPTLSGNNIQLD